MVLKLLIGNRFEAGVHRVQRIPLTDKTRMHTSTASVAVLPEPEEVSVVVPADSVKIETMRASGPGGQNVNKRSTAVRITHKETGIAVHCMEERFQHLNLQVQLRFVLLRAPAKIAFKRLAAILMQQKVDELNEKFTSDRKLQVTNVAEFLRGEESLDNVIQRLGAMYKEEKLKHILEHCIVE
ncbi:peptidyl-tRNA hydrolase domain protein [Teladorsagia circumcincta]|uniref:Peptidyl-tRNA hydrolase domain protein n=1 Tax=Teladorsagia circumcincta TaxID=45464 RepID=A0A2G9U3U4_TELCI|nr:peptidyl-tRNA hydrolase domain protein [Teladorsagia circumcincta]